MVDGYYPGGHTTPPHCEHFSGEATDMIQPAPEKAKRLVCA